MEGRPAPCSEKGLLMNKAVKDFSDHYHMLDALIAEEATSQLAEGEFTIKMIAERVGCGTQKAQRIIHGWVRDGKAEFVGKRAGAHGQSVSAWKSLGRALRDYPGRAGELA